MKTHPCLRALVLFALLSAGLAFAATPPAQAPAAPRKVDEKNAPAYRIAHGDTLAVSVYGEQDLNRGGNKVEPRGTVTLPLINEVRLAGMTVLEAQAAIENAYREQRYLRNPQVSVTIEGYVRRVVSISGKVIAPGTKELPPDRKMTIKELILLAGGFQETAKGTDVRLTRTLPDGSIKTVHLDVQSALLGKNNSTVNDANFELEAEDNVYVPEKII